MENARDTISIGEERTEAQRPESNTGTGDFSENSTDTGNMENQTGGDQTIFHFIFILSLFLPFFLGHNGIPLWYFFISAHFFRA